MKKIIIFSFCFIFVLLCGCNKKGSDVTAVTTGLSFTAEIENDGFFSECIVEIGSHGDFKINFLKPQNIENMLVFVSDDEITVNYKGLTYTESIYALQGGSNIDFLYSVFSDIRKNERKVENGNDEFYILGDAGRYSYKMLLGESGLPIQITDKSGISVAIKNAVIIKE